MSTDTTELTVRQTQMVEGAKRVRHVDQLDEKARVALRAMRDGETRAVSGLDAGEVIKSTTYLRVVAAQTPRTAGTERELATA